MLLYKKIVVMIVTLLLACSVSACKKEDILLEEKLIENTEDVSTEKTEEEDASLHWEKGYNLPVSEADLKEAEEECRTIASAVKEKLPDIGKDNNTGVSENEKIVIEVINQKGFPVSGTDFYLGLIPYENMETFIEDVQSGIMSEIVFYDIHTELGFARMKFTFNGKEMYCLHTNLSWNTEGKPIIAETSCSRIKEWTYTEKGWFCYELCVPEPPEVTELVNGNCLLRVKPLAEEYIKPSKEYVLPLGYQGNNLLCSNWTEGNMDSLDYNGMFEYFYQMKYGSRLEEQTYVNGIPQEEFERLIMQYLPITEKQIREWAVYDESNHTYAWARLGCGNYAPTSFGTSVPEVVAVRQNDDGTVTLKVDAVCGLAISDDAVISHEVRIQYQGDGGFKYLGNKILDHGVDKIPEYQYRFTEKKS